ncbi:MAG: helix-turn-helix transcriptional regulator [Clostridia bacterium]|nr:helix-turn-helix transcriptional regulator [Clostridia bacterium]
MKQDKFLFDMGQRVSRRRRALHMTQEQLADSVGVSTQMISNMELGKKAVRPENLYKICEVLEIGSDFILSGRGEDACKTDSEEISKNKAFIISCLDEMSAKEIELIKELVEYIKTK